MTTNDAHVARAERAFRSESVRYEKGSAMTLIADEATAMEKKTARLRALRMEREAAVVAETPPPGRKTTKRSAGR